MPWSWWPIGLVTVNVLAAEAHGGEGSDLVAVLLYTLPTVVVLGALLTLSRRRLRVVDGVLHVPGARAPLSAFGRPEQLDRPLMRQWLGPRAQRWALVAVRPWLGVGVRLPVVDPDDDTPYWLVGTRHPDRLLAALARD